MTPSGDHYSVAEPFIKNKVHVICDKPLTATIEEAHKLQQIVKENNIIFALTHNYSAYPMLREAKKLLKMAKSAKCDLLILNILKDIRRE